MNSETLQLYFDWMLSIVFGDDIDTPSQYSNLLMYLFDTDFIALIPRDENRFSDGINLRYRFCCECKIPDEFYHELNKIKKCSVLEMMIALALRCEDSIMSDPDLGNRTFVWFMEMLRSLKLIDMTNLVYNSLYVKICVDEFLMRKYKPDGSGGLFTIPGIDRDMREVEIWCQMCWYLNTLVQ